MIVYFTKRNYNFFSWTVRIATGKSYSHVAVQLDQYVYEAVFGGVRKVHWSEFYERNWIVDSHYVECNEFIAAERARDKLGKAYDIPALIWFLVVLFANKLGITIKQIKINPKWFLCSEYVWYIMKGKLKTVTPEQIYLEVTRKNEVQ